MNDDLERIVLVGGGLAAAKAAESIREGGFTGHVALVTDEPERPYERPPLSKGILTGERPADEAYVHPIDFYEQQDIELVTADAAVEIERDRRLIRTASGIELPYDRLLLATGARPRRLPLGDVELRGVVTLRTLADARRLADELTRVEHVTVIGAGWIGCEVAAAARSLGVPVTMVDPLSVPLERALGERVGSIFARLHAEHGVDLRMGVGVSGVSGRERVERVELSDGTSVGTDLVVVGIGVVPNTELAERCGLEVRNGVLVDQRLATSDPSILAAGDVANAWHPLLDRHIRVEHWANALNQGATAGRNLLGAEETYERLPYFYTDQYELSMEYVGLATDWDEVMVRGDPGTLEFIAFWLHEGRVVAGMNVNVWDVVDDLKALVASPRRPDPERLADPHIPLDALV